MDDKKLTELIERVEGIVVWAETVEELISSSIADLDGRTKAAIAALGQAEKAATANFLAALKKEALELQQERDGRGSVVPLLWVSTIFCLLCGIIMAWVVLRIT